MQITPELDQEKRMLFEKKSQLTIKMHSLENKLMTIKNEIRGKGLMPKADYLKLVSNQVKYRQEIVACEKSLAPVKNRLVEIADLQHEADQQARQAKLEVMPGPALVGSNPALVQDLVVLRQHYQEFAADITRVGSMRQMAAEFVLKLNKIIKDEVNRPPTENGNGNGVPESLDR